ncbi:MAG: cysteine desulfurase, partial [Gemmatimonadales bacterium]
GSIRAGLVFALKEAVGPEAVREREQALIKRAIESWGNDPNIEILGDPAPERLSIVSFVLRSGDRYLHHNYVVALLNDLFGIQSRGGCSCAGPYGHRLLGIDVEKSREFEREISRGCEGIKPGWVRVNYNYFISETVFQFILDAVHFVAEHGWTLLEHYDFDPHTGLWTHVRGRSEPPMSLWDVRFTPNGIEFPRHRYSAGEGDLASYLEEAERVVAAGGSTLATRGRCTGDVTGDFEHLRWFPVPGEAGEAG